MLCSIIRATSNRGINGYAQQLVSTMEIARCSLGSNFQAFAGWNFSTDNVHTIYIIYTTFIRRRKRHSFLWISQVDTPSEIIPMFATLFASNIGSTEDKVVGIEAMGCGVSSAHLARTSVANWLKTSIQA